MTSGDATPLVADAWHDGHVIHTFELRGVVSRSSSGIVYRAWDRGLDIAVAIKEHLPIPLARRLGNGDVAPATPSVGAAYESSLRAFIDGTRALARCDHPALVRMLHLHTVHGTAYRVMPRVVGGPLREVRYGMSRPLDEQALRALLEDLLGALEAVHCAGIVHGGVHPSKILLPPSNLPVLLGPRAIAADVGGAPLGPWTDLRALADVARFCIGGIPPTVDGQPVEPTAQVVERLILKDRALRYGQKFMRVLDAAASPDIARRPQSVAQFRDQLREAALIDGGSKAAHGPAPTHGPRPGSGQAASDVALQTMIQRVIAAIPARTPAKPQPLRQDPTFAAHEQPLRSAASEPFNDTGDLPPTRRRAATRRGAWSGARVVAILLALVGLGAWQWLYKPSSKGVAPSASGVATTPLSAVPSPAPVISTQTPEPELPVIEAVAPSTAAAAPRLVEAPKAKSMSAAPPIESAVAKPTPLSSPREACGERTPFSLYLCMQQQCARAGWANHPQCVRFRATDQVE